MLKQKCQLMRSKLKHRESGAFSVSSRVREVDAQTRTGWAGGEGSSHWPHKEAFQSKGAVIWARAKGGQTPKNVGIYTMDSADFFHWANNFFIIKITLSITS